jgi:hypothetical protein
MDVFEALGLAVPNSMSNPAAAGHDEEMGFLSQVFDWDEDLAAVNR